ncbi:MAG TPA: AMP-binding protein [Pseudonocardia sp.]
MSEMDIAGYLERANRLYPDRLAVVCGEQRLTYREVYDYAIRVAGGLLELGLRRGDHVVDARWNGVEAVVYDWALALAGLVKVPLTPRLSAAEIAHLVRNADARAFLTEADQVEAIEAVRDGAPGVDFIVADSLPGILSSRHVVGSPLRDRIPNDPADLYALRYTGGTTGLPKAATQTHRAFVATAVNILLDYMDLREDDVLFPTQPYTHGGGIYTLPTAMRGCAQVFQRRFDVDGVLDIVERERVTVIKIVPTILYRLIQAQRDRPRDISTLRLVGYGAAPMPEQLLREGMEVFGCGFTQTYGSASAPATISTLNAQVHEQERRTPSKRLRSVGRPYCMTDVQIVDEDGRCLADGEVGEVTVGGPFVTEGFWNDPAESAKAVRNGRVFTGDLGYLEQGFLYLVGRMNDLINSGGFNVYPAEVEQVLISAPGVADAAVTAVPDPEWGERVVCAVVRQSGREASPGEILRYVRERLAGYKCPKYLHFVDRLPQTPNAKVDRKAVRALIQAALAEQPVGTG